MTQPKLLSDLVKSDSPSEIIKEVVHIFQLISPDLDMRIIHLAFEKAIDLYEGKLNGFKACNTQ